MNGRIIIVLSPVLLSAAVCAAIAWYAWQRRTIPGAKAFFISVAAQLLWIIAHIFEKLSPTLSGKLFWDNVTVIAAVSYVLAFLAFTLAFTGLRPSRPRLVYGLLAIPGVFFAVVYFTMPLWEWVRVNPVLVSGAPFAALQYRPGVIAWAAALYGCLLLLAGLVVLVLQLFFTSARGQIIVIVLGVLISLVPHILRMVGVTLTLDPDLMPIAFALSNLLIAYGVFRHHLLQWAPVTRSAIIEGIDTAILVFAEGGRLIEFNQAAQTVFAGALQVGEDATTILAPYPAVATQYQAQIPYQKATICHGGQSHYYDVSFSRQQKRQGGIVNYLLTLHNVDERERMEQALRASEEKHRMLAENVDDFIWILDDKLEQYTYVNPAVTKLLGYTPAEMMNKSPAEIVPPSQADRTNQVIQKRLAAEAAGRGDDEIRRWDGRYLHKNGAVVWIEAVTRPLRDKDGRFSGLIGVSRNISERKQMEQALRESERRYKEAERIAHLGNWEMEIATGKAYWSDEFFRICGYEPGSVAPSSEAGFKIIHPDDRERAAQAVNGAIESGEPYDIEKRIVRPDGSIRWVHSLGEVICDEAQHPVKLTGSFLDITERKRAEEALQVSEARFRRIFEENPLGIALVSSESQRLVQVNGRFCAMSGYTESELLALSVMDITHPDDLEKESRLIARIEKGDMRGFAVEKRYVKKGGKIWWGKLTAARIPSIGEEGPVGLGIVEDITERKRIEAEREQLVQELQAALAQVRQLKSLLPICSSCKKIRDDDGYWRHVEVYIRQHAGVDFSHSMCPDCMRDYYPPAQFPGLYEDKT